MDKLAINVNGCEKFATGLTKSTTIDDIKYAMLCTSKNSSDSLDIDDYGVFERWQDNERLLDGRVKIYKLIRLWQSLPGDQLSQVKFLIKKKKSPLTVSAARSKLAARNTNVDHSVPPSFAMCTLSPAMEKSWNYQKLSRKSAYVNRQLRLVAAGDFCEKSTCSSDEQLSSSESDNEVNPTRRRYASIKRYHRSKRSTIKKCSQIKSAYVDLVDKQNEIIQRQMRKLSRGRSSSQKRDDQTELNQFFDKYLNVEHCLDQKLAKIKSLKNELDALLDETDTDKLAKTSANLKASIELDRQQTDQLKSMECAIERIDDIIMLKQKSVETLEDELQRLEEMVLVSANREDPLYVKPSKMSKSSSTSSTSSSQSSTSSLFTSISSINSQSSLKNISQMQMISTGNKSCESYFGNDNESDTGISSANSEEFSLQQLETLV